MTIEEKQQALQELNTRLATDVTLPLKAAATHDVPGDGNPDADVLFIGEAPGAKEDALGLPFVGAAGKFLDELIASIGLKRKDVFIANVIKHRPPGNRDPLPEEIAVYTPYLIEQITIIDPKLIVTLGRFSMDFILGSGFSITAIHGQPKRLPPERPVAPGVVVMPMYHPAAALYRGNLRQVLKDDFAKIPKILELIAAGKDSTQQEEVTAEPQEEQVSLL